jgi:hypothetical protein
LSLERALGGLVGARGGLVGARCAEIVAFDVEIQQIVHGSTLIAIALAAAAARRHPISTRDATKSSQSLGRRRPPRRAAKRGRSRPVAHATPTGCGQTVDNRAKAMHIGGRARLTRPHPGP